MAGVAATVRLDSRRLDRMIAQMLPRARRVVRQAAEEGAHLARSYAPVRTGRLSRSYRAQRDQADSLALTYDVLSDVPYASFVEFGTRFMAPRPHLTPAMEEVRARFGPMVREIFA